MRRSVLRRLTWLGVLAGCCLGAASTAGAAADGPRPLRELDDEPAPPAAHPKDAVIVTTPDEVRAAVDRNIDQGALVIKVYYRLPADLIAVATEAAHARGVPVTAHLELVPAVDGIRAGLDGIEHVTSF